jgi:hypothetical protein
MPFMNVLCGRGGGLHQFCFIQRSVGFCSWLSCLQTALAVARRKQPHNSSSPWRSPIYCVEKMSVGWFQDATLLLTLESFASHPYPLPYLYGSRECKLYRCGFRRHWRDVDRHAGCVFVCRFRLRDQVWLLHGFIRLPCYFVGWYFLRRFRAKLRHPVSSTY